MADFFHQQYWQPIYNLYLQVFILCHAATPTVLNSAPSSSIWQRFERLWTRESMAMCVGNLEGIGAFILWSWYHHLQYHHQCLSFTLVTMKMILSLGVLSQCVEWWQVLRWWILCWPSIDDEKGSFRPKICGKSEMRFRHLTLIPKMTIFWMKPTFSKPSFWVSSR